MKSGEATRAEGSAKAEAGKQLGPYMPKADKLREQEGREGGRNQGCGAAGAVSAEG